MKLGLCYMVFDGEELLEFAAKNIRTQVDFISVTYQTTSYFGNPSDPELPSLIKRLEKEGLIDSSLHYEPNLKLTPKENELILRNLGLANSRNAGCSHHISADVDEFYKPEQLKYAKDVMTENNYDFSTAYLATYYKEPTYLVTPIQKLLVSFIHPVTNEYNKDIPYPTFPFHMETTRRLSKHEHYRVFTADEFMIHHMSYVRKDIRKKFANSDNARFYNLNKFYKTFDNYKVGQRVCLLPEYLNRKTIEVENTFGIHFK